jgi:hypothetical protein
MVMLGDDELQRRLGYHPVGPATAPMFELNRALALLVGAVWGRMLPPSREAALAQTELEAALQRANQAVACNLDPESAPMPELDVATFLDDVIERIEGPEMRRSGPPAPLGGSDRPDDRSPAADALAARMDAASLTPLAARSGDQLAERRRAHESDDDL